MAKEIKEKIPPQNIEVEQSVLGSLLIDKEAIIKIADSLMPTDFYKDTHRSIYEAMLDLYRNREPIDVVSLTNRLTERQELKTIGGRSYLASLANSVPTASHVSTYAQIIQKKATLRRLIHAAADINELAYQEEEDADKILDEAEKKVFSVSQQHQTQAFTSLKDTLNEAFDRIDELHKGGGKIKGLPTGFSDLDNVIAGLQKSDLIILAARPSMGKTSLALDMARNIAVNTKTPVGIFSLEMSKDSITDRLICSQANVNLWKMRTGHLSTKKEDDEFPRIGQALGVLSDAPVYIDDSAMANIMQIRTRARRLQAEHGLGVLIIDYLQLMEGDRLYNSGRVQEVSDISRGLKAIARELDIPVLALSQLSRAVESRHPPIPKLADLRESGSIEQDADLVMFIYREEMYKRETDRKNIADIFIAKHRNGPTGAIQLYFDSNTASFRNLERSGETVPDLDENFSEEFTTQINF
ncbi:MAG: replicative DNA helicase [Patescibacteria group bacterium]|nr:replicative DNA helicase [Patescibacteria group bacterium]